LKRWYLLAYDIRENRRLRRIHACLKKQAVAFQKSVFLLHEDREGLEHILEQVRACADDQADDVRLYPVHSPNDLWTAGLQAEKFQGLYSGGSGSEGGRPRRRKQRR